MRISFSFLLFSYWVSFKGDFGGVVRDGLKFVHAWWLRWEGAARCAYLERSIVGNGTGWKRDGTVQSAGPGAGTGEGLVSYMMGLAHDGDTYSHRFPKSGVMRLPNIPTDPRARLVSLHPLPRAPMSIIKKEDGSSVIGHRIYTEEHMKQGYTLFYTKCMDWLVGIYLVRDLGIGYMMWVW